MTTDLATRVPAQLPESVEQALVNGDLAKLSATERVTLYLELCSSLHLNPLSVPFQYITLNGRLVLYAVKNCTDQLRFIHSVNVEIVSRERMDDIYVVTTRATLPNGRTDEEIGAVPIANLKGEALANALMKASTKSKRRVTLAIVGLSMLDETEVDSIRDAHQPKFQVTVDPTTREITEQGEPEMETQPEGTAAITPERRRELLMDRYAELWHQALTLSIEVPVAGTQSDWSDRELADACKALKAKIQAEPEPVPA